MTLLDWLGVGGGVLSLVAVASAVVWWQVPPVRPYARAALQALSWLALAGLIPLAVGILTRRRPRREAPTTARPADRAEDLRDLRRQSARAEHTESRATTTEAVADPDPSAGWAALDNEERRLRAAMEES